MSWWRSPRGGALSRARHEAALVALRVLVTRHPRAAFDMAAAAALRAGRVGVQTLTERLQPREVPQPIPAVRRLTRREVRRFLKAIHRTDRHGTRTALVAEAANNRPG